MADRGVVRLMSLPPDESPLHADDSVSAAAGSVDARAKWVLAVGLACSSFPAILVRYAVAPAIVIAFWRKLFAALILLPLVVTRLRKEPWDWALQRKLMPYTVGTGLVLAVHFGTWIGSVQLTTVASALLVYSTQPVWGGLLGFIFLKERVPKRGMAAIALAMAGVALIAWGDFGRGPRSLLGDGLALAAAIAGASYLTVGRHLRDKIPLVQYLFLLYAVAAGGLCAAASIAGEPLRGFSASTWLMFGLLAIFPSSLGHNLVNYAVRHIESYRVIISLLVEPVVSTLLAALLFAEYPSARFYAGALLVFAGILLAMRGSGPAGKRYPLNS